MHKLSLPLLRLVLAFAAMLVYGCTGIVGYEIARTDVPTSTSFYKAALAGCPEGKMPITGGYRISDGGGAGNNYVIMVNGPEYSNPSGTLANWVVQARALGSGSWSLTAYAACVDVKR